MNECVHWMEHKLSLSRTFLCTPLKIHAWIAWESERKKERDINRINFFSHWYSAKPLVVFCWNCLTEASIRIYMRYSLNKQFLFQDLTCSAMFTFYRSDVILYFADPIHRKITKKEYWIRKINIWCGYKSMMTLWQFIFEVKYIQIINRMRKICAANECLWLSQKIPTYAFKMVKMSINIHVEQCQFNW